MRTLQWAVLLLWLWPELGEATELPEPDSELPPPVLSTTWHDLIRLEVTTLALRPRATAGTDEAFAQVNHAR